MGCPKFVGFPSSESIIHPAQLSCTGQCKIIGQARQKGLAVQGEGGSLVQERGDSSDPTEVLASEVSHDVPFERVPVTGGDQNSGSVINQLL